MLLWLSIFLKVPEFDVYAGYGYTIIQGFSKYIEIL